MDRLEKEYSVRPFQPGDEEGIVELLELVFDGWPRFGLLCSPLEHWKWKYLNNPLWKNQIIVGVSDHRIISCVHYPSLRIKIGHGVCLGTQGLDLAVHSDFRGVALFKTMWDLGIKMRKESGIQLHYCLTWNPMLSKYLSKVYHKFPHQVMRLFRIHDVGLHLRKQPMKYGFFYEYGGYLVNLANKYRNTLRPDRPSSYDFHVVEMTHFDERMEGFWEEIREHYSFIIERSQDYLNWRYGDPRGGDYLVKSAERDGNILGYMVLRVDRYQQDYPVGYMVDLLTLPNRLDVAMALVGDAVNYFDGHGINMIFCLVIKNHPYEVILKRNGFITKRERVPFFYREYAEVEELRKRETRSPSRIHFAYGDLDVI
ncbi:MAG: hypothetical protein A2026_08940 [Deltaproteobacteria bacterium RBG_19FT_COMBO_46_12]|nr:MAG: hypothetical protein A2026_08940 [Deltaproteobacteria bacterium RBG_19FT_COMBO_46_12]